MNVSKIVDMYDNGEAPELLQDPPNVSAFRTRVNAQNINQTISVPVIVQEAQQIVTSIAKMNGGTCTAADVKAARDIVTARPLQTDAEARFAKLRAAIISGEVTTIQQLKDKFIE